MGDKEQLKAKFFRVYSTLPINVRKEVVLDLDGDQPGGITWELAYIEISDNTPLGEIVLERLNQLGIITLD